MFRPPLRRRLGCRALAALAILALAGSFTPGCRQSAGPGGEGAPRSSAGTDTATAAPDGARRPSIVVLGDSLSAGYGLPPDAAYPALLQKRIDAAGYGLEVVNMGVSGDTTAGGVSRLEWALDGDVRVLVLALGANDGLRGLSTSEVQSNLGRMIDAARARGVRVLLCGMQAPPNFGLGYTRQFRAVYETLAREKDVTFVPFLLEGVAGIPSLNQADGIHPNEAGTRLVADAVWKHLEPLLKDAGTR